MSSLVCEVHFLEFFLSGNKVDVIFYFKGINYVEVEIDGYSLSRLDRPRNMKNEFGGGVCAYMRKTLKSKVLKDLSGISDTGFHQLWMQVQHTYKPPDCNVACFEDFRDRYTQALVYGLPILVVGDLNCDLLISSSKSRTLNNLCTSLNMKQLITQPQEWQKHLNL